VVYDFRVMAPDQPLCITPPGWPLEDGVEANLREGLNSCPDLAFAHLVDVDVPDQGEGPGMVLFVWLVPAAMKSIRAALNLVSEVVAKALPGDRYLDVVILNSAPEILLEVERAGCLFVERHPDERRRALAAASENSGSD
jgi:hypothetical protein